MMRTTLPPYRSTTLLLACASLALASCADDDDFFAPIPPTGVATLDGIDLTVGTDNIVPLPASVDDRIEAVFDRYSAITAPNGRRIHFLTQTGVSDDLLLRTRGIVRDMLRDVPLTTLGADKSAAFNAAASAEAILAIHTDASTFDAMDADVAAFITLADTRLETLDASTIVQEGSATYIQASPAIDPSFRTALELILDRGITAGSSAFQAALTAATDNAVMNNLYRPDAMLPTEGIDNDYLAIALESYYGVWGHDPNMDGTAGVAGEYDFDDRGAMQVGDPTLVALIEDFFVPTHTYSAFLDSTFAGTFEMQFDALTAYTNRSQYLERCGIRGVSTARINGNDLDNIFLGSDAASDFEGRGGNDNIDSGAGLDRVFMSGNQADYTVTAVSATITRIEDSVGNRDGIDDLRGVRQIVFLDATLDL